MNELIKIKEDINKTVDAFLETNNDLQAIMKYAKNRLEKVRLNDRQKKKFERYQFAYSLAASGEYTDADIVNMLCSMYEIEISQAYEDFRCMKEFIPKIINLNKQYELQVALELDKKMIAKCIATDDYKNYAAIRRNQNQTLAQIEEAEDNAADDFEGHTYEPAFDPALLGKQVEQIDLNEVLAVINEKKKVKLNISDIVGTPIPYEDIIPTDKEDPLQPAAAP